MYFTTTLLQAKDINTLEDLNKAFPGQVDQIREWFR
jgi:inorganic pyrophosphatase